MAATTGNANVEVHVGEVPKASRARGFTVSLILPSTIAGVLGAAGAYGAHSVSNPEPQTAMISRVEFDRQQLDFEGRLRMLETDKIEAARWRQEVSDSLDGLKKQSTEIHNALDKMVDRKDRNR